MHKFIFVDTEVRINLHSNITTAKTVIFIIGKLSSQDIAKWGKRGIRQWASLPVTLPSVNQF